VFNTKFYLTYHPEEKKIVTTLVNGLWEINSVTQELIRIPVISRINQEHTYFRERRSAAISFNKETQNNLL